MARHTTNYVNTFIEVAEDCPVSRAEAPPNTENKKTVAARQFDMILANPYRYTSDDVLFQVYAERNQFVEAEYELARAAFFSKGQPCLRSSPLTKRYGWGIHADNEGKIALYGMETAEYQQFAASNRLKVVKAMRSKRK